MVNDDRITVGVINSNAEIIELLLMAFEMAGYKTVSEHLQTFKLNPRKFPKFVEQTKAQILIIDVPPPYEENWGFAQKLQDIDVKGRVAFVFTTTNKKNLEKLVGQNESIEIVGKPFDLEEVVDAASRAYKNLPRNNLITITYPEEVLT